MVYSSWSVFVLLNSVSILTARIGVYLPIVFERLAPQQNRQLCGDVCHADQYVANLDSQFQLMQTRSAWLVQYNVGSNKPVG